MLFPFFSHEVLGVLLRLLYVSKRCYSDLADVRVHYSLREMWESIIFQKKYGSLLASRVDVGVFKLYLSGSVGIQVLYSADDYFAVRDF